MHPSCACTSMTPAACVMAVLRLPPKHHGDAKLRAHCHGARRVGADAAAAFYPLVECLRKAAATQRLCLLHCVHAPAGVKGRRSENF